MRDGNLTEKTEKNFSLFFILVHGFQEESIQVIIIIRKYLINFAKKEKDLQFASLEEIKCVKLCVFISIHNFVKKLKF